jgi:hypothetical protein
MTNAGIPDSAMMNDLETVGNAQVSTSVKKFGTGSLKFSGSSGGTTDCILASAPASPLYSPSSSFTVEFWIYPLGTGDTNQYWVGNYNGGNNGWDLRYQDLGNAVNGVSYENTASSKVIGFTSSAISSNTWQFITASWDSSGNCYVFVNGVLLRTLTSFSTTTNDILNIGRQRDVSNRFFQGYIDDLRITKGYARYTSNFTAPTAPFYTY